MSYKPTNEDVIAYLYGEMEASQRAQIDQYMQEHPEFRSEVEDMESTRMLMGQLEDEEVPSPMTFMASNTNSEWAYWRKYAAIAATILVIMAFGKISGFNLIYGEEGFQAGFGTVEQGMNADDINELLQANREETINFMRENMASFQDSLGNEFNAIQASFERSQEDSPETPIFSDADINRLLDQQKQDILDQMSQYSSKLTDDYRDIFKDLYDSFSDDIQTQRHDDLRDIQAAFNTLENTTLTNKEEVDEALFNLSQEVNALLAQNNNNNNN